MEVIQAVRADGWVRVRETWIPVTGKVPLRAGQSIAVMWRDGTPQVAMMNQARRSGGDALLTVPALGLVEELFIATRPDGVRDVYFRNYDATTALQLDRFVETSAFSTLRWGTLNDRFFVQYGIGKYRIFRFDRNADEPFAAGQDPSGAVSLERSDDLATNSMTVATLSAVNQSPATVTLTPASPSFPGSASLSAALNQVDTLLDPDGNLIVAYDLRITLPATFEAGPIPGPFALNLATLGTLVGELHYPIVVDATQQVKILDMFATPDFLSEWPAVPDYNSLDLAASGGRPSGGLLVPTTWMPANAFTRPLADPPPDTLTITWQCGKSDTPVVWRYLLDPFLVLEPGSGKRLLGFVALAFFQYPAFAVQTFDLPTFSTYIPPSGGEFPTCSAVQTPQAGAVVQAPRRTELLVLFPIARPAGGLSFASTWDHLVWRSPSGGSFFPGGDLDTGGADSEGFVTSYASGAAKRIADTLRAKFGQRGVQVLPSDFLYQADAPPVALPPNAETKFFIDGWDGGTGQVTLDADAAAFPLEDLGLAEVKGLADIPDGVTQPSQLGERVFYVNNTEAELRAAGRFHELPTGSGEHKR